MKKRIVTWAFAMACAALTAGPRAPETGAAPAVDFNREIRPILSDNCFRCHGPDSGTRKAQLRLDTQEGVKAKPGVIVPGDPGASRLLQRIRSTDPAEVMPPPASGHKLTAQQIELFARWISEGARWSAHWAFVAPRRPALPEVANKRWPRNPIDRFVLARL